MSKLKSQSLARKIHNVSTAFRACPRWASHLRAGKTFCSRIGLDHRASDLSSTGPRFEAIRRWSSLSGPRSGVAGESDPIAERRKRFSSCKVGQRSSTVDYNCGRHHWKTVENIRESIVSKPWSDGSCCGFSSTAVAAGFHQELKPASLFRIGLQFLYLTMMVNQITQEQDSVAGIAFGPPAASCFDNARLGPGNRIEPTNCLYSVEANSCSVRDSLDFVKRDTIISPVIKTRRAF